METDKKMFLFYSGYGMMKSLMKKRFEYIKTFPVKRFLMVWLNFAIAVCMFLLMNVCLKIHYDWKTILLSFTGWVGIGNSNWYMFVIFALYIMFFLSFYFLRWQDGKYSCHIGMGLFTILSVVFVYWEMRMGQPSWFYNTVILFAMGGWFALLQDKIQRILWKNDMIYILVVACMVMVYWFSFKHRKNGIEIYSVWAVAFTLLVVMATMKIKMKSTSLAWMGQHVFSIYILQRIPMTILATTGFTKGSPYAFVVISFVLTLAISVIFDYVTCRIACKITLKR